MSLFHLNEKSTIGWIGTGVMGRSMFGHILDKGYRGFVFTRTKEKASSLIEKGATWCHSPAEVARQAAGRSTTLPHASFAVILSPAFLSVTSSRT